VTATLGPADTTESTVESEATAPSTSVPLDAGTVVKGPLLEIDESLSADVHATAPTSKAPHPKFRHPLEAITSV
jgi:hypothetical protein